MKTLKFIFALSFIFCGLININAQVTSNQNVNNNNNTIIIQNQPVIEKNIYIERYRTVYVDRPQPKRVARKLSAPICLLGYLWVYPEDLGTYMSGPTSIIAQINAQGQYGRNDWRVPSPDELRLMENYADKCGLGDDIYLATDHRNGVLRLVSTGKTIAQQQQEAKEAERQRQIEEQRQRELREQRLRAQQLEEQRQRELREQRQREEAAAAARAHSQEVANQNSLISSGSAILVDGTVWDTKNKGASYSSDKGVLYPVGQNTSSGKWRLPTENEFYAVLRQGQNDGSFLRMNNGLVIPIGTYAVQLKTGSIGYINLQNGFTGTGNASAFIRYVQNRLY
ncbi:MAG: hypothetical protein IJ154_00125 [Bacteroidales bacterium]|nr:hypothetical protein [Bacteroidales bacterium]